MGKIFILSGPSGVGKDTVLKALKRSGLPLHFAITITTRKKRADEIDGKDYHFVSEGEFEVMIRDGKLIEWSKVYGNWYGVPREEIEKPIKEGRGVLLRVDVQGARKLKNLFPDAILIFLSPPNLDQLIERLKRRNTESSQEQDIRLKFVEEELGALSLFDYNVVNEDLKEAVAEIESIIRSHL